MATSSRRQYAYVSSMAAAEGAAWRAPDWEPDFCEADGGKLTKPRFPVAYTTDRRKAMAGIKRAGRSGFDLAGYQLYALADLDTCSPLQESAPAVGAVRVHRDGLLRWRIFAWCWGLQLRLALADLAEFLFAKGARARLRARVVASAAVSGIVLGWESGAGPHTDRLSKVMPWMRRWGTMSMRFPAAAYGWGLCTRSAPGQAWPTREAMLGIPAAVIGRYLIGVHEQVPAAEVVEAGLQCISWPR
jgi:hypothetical protein